MTRTFISAGWPYMYEIPGLHNCIPMLFADAMARYRRFRGDEVLFVSGADEHGPRVEYVAEGQGKSPRDLVDEKVAATRPLLERLQLSMSLFARTTDPSHVRFVQNFISRLLHVGAAERWRVQVPYCSACHKHLPDRFIEGFCPKCGQAAFGNQCNNKRSCGVLLDPFQLVGGRCAICGGPVQERDRTHLYLPFAPYRETLRRHIEASYEGTPGVRDKALKILATTDGMTLTRDTPWGVTLPASVNLRGRTVYSWVDSLLGKISAADALDRRRAMWGSPDTEKLFFLGADGVGFYAVLFPALILASRNGDSIDGFKIVTNDVLIYEGGVCSKSSQTGIWLQEALDLLPADYWRFVIFDAEARASRTGAPAGSADMDFRWDIFAASANEKLGAIGAVYASLGGSHPVPDPNAPGLDAVRDALETLRPGKAFGHLTDAFLHVADVNKPGLAAGALPYLSCFLPEVAARAAALLDRADGLPLFPELPLLGAALRSRYAEAVSKRRSALDLAAELESVRAEALCVCPTRLEEN